MLFVSTKVTIIAADYIYRLQVVHTTVNVISNWFRVAQDIYIAREKKHNSFSYFFFLQYWYIYWDLTTGRNSSWEKEKEEREREKERGNVCKFVEEEITQHCANTLMIIFVEIRKFIETFNLQPYHRFVAPFILTR